MATRRMRIVGEYTSTLNDAGGISDTDTSVIVTSVSGLPTTGDYFLLIEEEVVLVTALSGSTLTIVRGQEGTTAASHADGSTIQSIATAGTFEGLLKDANGIKCLPYGRIMKADGTHLTASDWTLINTGTGTTVVDGNDGIITFTAKDMSGNDSTGIKRDFGTATDHRITAHIGCPAMLQTSPDILSFYSRQSSGGTMDGIQLYPQNKVTVDQRVTYLGSPTADVTHGVAAMRDLWVRLEIEWNVVASTDHLRWYYSIDGVHWWFAHTHTFAASTCQVGLWMTNVTGTIAYMRSHIYSWYEETLTF